MFDDRLQSLPLAAPYRRIESHENDTGHCHASAAAPLLTEVLVLGQQYTAFTRCHGEHLLVQNALRRIANENCIVSSYPQSIDEPGVHALVGEKFHGSARLTVDQLLVGHVVGGERLRRASIVLA